MASGPQHDRAIRNLATPYGLLAATIATALNAEDGLGAIARFLEYGAISYSGFLFGGLFLSPDLDTNSLPLKRWGWLKYIWYPYRDAVPHRGISHTPIVGTSTRLLYLAGILSAGLWGMGWLDDVVNLLAVHWFQCVLALVAIEASAWVHLFLDRK